MDKTLSPRGRRLVPGATAGSMVALALAARAGAAEPMRSVHLHNGGRFEVAYAPKYRASQVRI